MKKIGTYLFLLIFILSCKNKNEKLTELITSNSKDYINSKITKYNEVDELNDFSFVKTDTISELEEALMYTQFAVNSSKRNLEIARIENEKAKIQREINLTLGKTGNDYLVNAAIESYSKHLDSAKYFQKLAEHITSKLSVLDSIKPVYLNNRFFTKVKMKNKSIQSDTIEIITDVEGNIIEKNEIMKNVISKYK